MEYLIQNWDQILLVVTSIVTAASIIAKMTPTEVDDDILGQFIKLMDTLGLNTKPTVTK